MRARRAPFTFCGNGFVILGETTKLARNRAFTVDIAEALSQCPGRASTDDPACGVYYSPEPGSPFPPPTDVDIEMIPSIPARIYGQWPCCGAQVRAVKFGAHDAPSLRLHAQRAMPSRVSGGLVYSQFGCEFFDGLAEPLLSPYCPTSATSIATAIPSPANLGNSRRHLPIFFAFRAPRYPRAPPCANRSMGRARYLCDAPSQATLSFKLNMGFS